MNPKGLLPIGALSKATKVPIETIRYYEREGLIEEPVRGESGYRQYTSEVIARLYFIKRSKELGFTLKEIRELLSLRATENSRCNDVKEQAEAKISNIEEKIASLQRMKKALEKLVVECNGQSPIRECPILESLNSEL